MRSAAAVLLAVSIVAGGCASGPFSSTPPTIEPARPATSPRPATAPAGRVLPLAGEPRAAVLAGDSLVVLTPGADAGAPATLTIVGRSGDSRPLPLPGQAASIATDGHGTAYVAGRGGFFTVDLAAGTTTRNPIDEAVDFTAIARRADGRLVLGSSDGVAYTLAQDMSVAAKATGFARVDALATQGDVAVVLDRGQTSVTALRPDGSAAESLRAGIGATTIASDPAGRVLVADTRAGQLLVFGVEPLILRQAYPVGDSPYGLVGSRSLVWISLTPTNTVVGYDLATGIPVEKVRYPTVQQPNSLAYDESSDTLYVVSGAGAGVQVIGHASGAR